MYYYSTRRKNSSVSLIFIRRINWIVPSKDTTSTYFFFVIPDTLFVVDSLSNNTAYHVRVRSLNAAGFSDWLEIAEPAKTINYAGRVAATLILIISAFVFTLCY